MSLFNFFKNAAIVGGEQAGEGAVKLTVALMGDDAAADVAVKQKQDELDQKVRFLADAKVDWEREYKEFEAEQGIHDRFMAEANAITGLLAQPDCQNADELNADLNYILDKLEAHAPKLSKEKKEADDAKAWLDEVQGYVDEMGAELIALRATLNSNKQAIKQAEIENERAEKQLKQAEILAGLSKASGKYDIAINSMSEKASKIQKEAEVNKLKAAALRQPKAVEDDGSSVLGKYTQAATAPTRNAADRLAALQGK